MVSRGNRHSLSLRSSEKDHEDPLRKLGDEGKNQKQEVLPVERFSKAKDGAKPKRREKAQKSAKKEVGERSRKFTVKTVSQKTIKKTSSSAPGLDVVDEESPGQEKEGLRIPAAVPSRSSQISHRIGMGDTGQSDLRPAIRPLQKISASSKSGPTETSDEDIVKMRRRFVRGERKDWGEERGRGSSKWMVYSGLGIVALIILTVVLSQMGGYEDIRESDESLYSRLKPAEEMSSDESKDLQVLEALTNSQGEAKELFSEFAAATSIEDFSETIFNKDRVLPLLEERWASLETGKDWVPGDEAIWSVLQHDGERYGLLVGKLPDFSDFTAFFRNTEAGFKIDWKATTGYGTATFDEMKSGVGDGSEIRAYISLADFYTFALPEEKFRAFRLASPDGTSNLWAYTLRGSELDEKIQKLFTPSQITGEAQTEARVTLRLEPGPEDGLKNQWKARELISLSWLDELPK